MKLTIVSLATLSLLGFSFVFGSHPTRGIAAGSQRGTTDFTPENLDCRGRSQLQLGQTAGRIRSIGSRCYRQAGDARPLLLDPKRDRGAAVFAGERFQCFEGSMMFELKGSTVKTGTTYTIRPADGCHMLKAPAVSRFKAPGVTESEGSASVQRSRVTVRAGTRRRRH